MGTLRIGSRGSALALWQAERIRMLLSDRGLTASIEIIRTTGDVVKGAPVHGLTGKDSFTKEIDEALLAGRIDLAVHSLKDVPIMLPEGLAMAAVPQREDPRDVIVSQDGRSLEGLPAGSRVGTGSVRRQAAVLFARPDLKVVPLHGNVPTRLARVSEGTVDAAVLAMAGLKRLERAEPRVPLDPAVFVPAPGQGAICVQARADDARTLEVLRPVDHGETRIAVEAERSALEGLESGCAVPIGAHCAMVDGELLLRVVVYAIDGSRALEATASVDAKDPTGSGWVAAQDLDAQGAADLIAQAIAAGEKE